MPSDIEHPMRAALFTDLYELRMAEAYMGEGMEERAVFELFFRRMPGERNFIIAAGLEHVLDYLAHWRFSGSDIDYLRRQGEYAPGFLDRLRETRFTGDVWAMREGTPVFPDEPLVRIEAPLFEAQLLETAVLNQIHFQSVIASKAARVVIAAEGRHVVDFGSRRAHGGDAALKAARATWLVGGAGTSNVHAGKLYGVPIFGTMAHSYIQAHESEERAFEAFAERFPGTTLLVDTYDTLQGVERAVELMRRRPDLDVNALRLDSGDLADLAKKTRATLDEAGFDRINIFASSGLDEHTIAELIDAGAPIDGFGVGTKLVVAPDAPDLDMAYKLVEYAGEGRLKLSSDKEIYPGRKQVFREVRGGTMRADVLARHDEHHPGEPLLEKVMERGRRTDEGRRSLDEARRHALAQLDRLPAPLRALSPASSPYKVLISGRLKSDKESVVRRLQPAPERG